MQTSPAFLQRLTWLCAPLRAHTSDVAARRGGLGGAANQVVRPAFDIKGHACVQDIGVFSKLSKIHQFFVRPASPSLFGPCHSRKLYVSALVHFFFILSIFLVLGGCVSTSNRDTAIRKVVRKEALLLKAVKLQRRSPEIASAVRKDEALSKAEDELNDVIEALIQSNSEVHRVLGH